jgi:acid phosphatase
VAKALQAGTTLQTLARMRMLRHTLLLPFFAFGLASCAVTSHEPQNLSTAKTRVTEYVTKHYDEDITKVSAQAQAWIGQRAAKGGGKLAVVFDIDETSLSNLSHIWAQDWGYVPADWDHWVATAKAPAIGPVREVYRTALDHKVAVIFLTARKESGRAATARNLRTQGMGQYAALIVKPDHGPKQTSAAYKSAQRERLTKEGYTIIANIGDQESDLAGGYAERTFKLPNPFYFIP